MSVEVEVGKLFGPHFFVAIKVRKGRYEGGVDPLNTARVERTIEDMGFNVVLMEQSVGKSRALLKVRIERQGDSAQERAVTVSDCAAVTRVLREVLEEEKEDWVLEVSSPGVERPLVKANDFDRFAGARVRVKGYERLANRAKKLEGTLLGLVEDEPQFFALDIEGDRVEIPLKAVALARLHPW